MGGGYAASSEPVTGFLVRAHPAGGGFGTPYDAACVVVADGDAAVVKGWVGPATLAAGRAFHAELRRLGFKRLRYERRKGDRAEVHEKAL